MAANIGLGCVTFGREIDKEASFALMDHARAMGVKTFDTAAVYGNGSSETIVGEWLTERGIKSGEISIATKILPPYTAAGIRVSIEASLKRLDIGTIALLYLHRWDDALTQPAAWLTLDSLKAKGKIKTIGASNFNEEQLTNSIALLKSIGGIQLSYIQNNHNLAVSDITPRMKALCADNNIKLVTYSPLGAGFLTGKHLNGVAADSRFAIMPAHQEIYFNEQANKRLHKLMEVAKRVNQSPTLLAMAWALYQPQTHTVLVGVRSVSQLDLTTEAIKFYAPEIFAELESV